MECVIVEAEVRPTESVDKVKKAILNVFTPDSLEVVDAGGGYRRVIARASTLMSLVKLHDLLRRERILDAARSHLLRGVYAGTLVFKVNKQAAFMGRVSFIDADTESPMGPIVFTILAGNPKEIVDWLTPPTRAGTPLYEKPIPQAACQP
ncbi:MAG: hypothetical protein DSY37_00565 [Hyperthermus sp.]|nr:MAG: hypothetical protein DSY37_00565 [Hyperthermus sp.]